MHKVEEHTKCFCEMAEKLVMAMKAEFEKGIEHVDTHEAGQVIDMIKDLCEAEEKLWKACYYKTVLEQMKEAKEEGMEEMPDMPLSWMLPNDRAGYDAWRYSNGHYAPKGRGHHVGRHGYPIGSGPYYPNPEWPDENYANLTGKIFPQDGRMGYPMDHMGQDMRSEYGKAYDKFRNSRRHYTETHSEHDREEMKMHGKEHVMEAVTAMKEIWSDADPDLRKQMKDSIMALVNDMK